MVVPNFDPGIHEREFVKRFGRRFLEPSPKTSDTGPSSYRINLFICFTNRCGSNFLGEALASSGRLSRAREIFNHRSVAEVLTQQSRLKTFSDYCEWQAENETRNGVFAAKVSSRQLAMLGRSGVIPGIFRENRFLFLRRRDLLGQAISLDLAQRTEGWERGEPEDEPVEFSARRLVLKTRGIAEANARFETLFALNGIEPFTLFYEDLAEDPAGSIAEIAGWLNDPEIRYVDENVSGRKQQDPRKDEWRMKFAEAAKESVNPR